MPDATTDLNNAVADLSLTRSAREVLDRAVVIASARGAPQTDPVDVLKATLQVVNYKNLDDMTEFKGQNTTTEFLTRWVFDRFAAAVKAGKLGRAAAEISAIRVTVGESPNARAWYEAPL